MDFAFAEGMIKYNRIIHAIYPCRKVATAFVSPVDIHSINYSFFSYAPDGPAASHVRAAAEANCFQIVQHWYGR
jgi:hypothetical protein